MEETKLANWTVDKSQTIFPATIVFVTILLIFCLSLLFVFVINQSVTLFSLIIPIVLFLVLVSVVPEFFKSLGAVKEATEITITERGLYRQNLEKKDQQQFIAWDHLTGYDMSYQHSATPLGKLFPRPTKFYLKSKFETDNFWIDAFGDDIDILRAYLKEHNVPFGFLKK